MLAAAIIRSFSKHSNIAKFLVKRGFIAFVVPCLQMRDVKHRGVSALGILQHINGLPITGSAHVLSRLCKSPSGT